eukprot:3687290-Amphidinium_carterae.1
MFTLLCPASDISSRRLEHEQRLRPASTMWRLSERCDTEYFIFSKNKSVYEFRTSLSYKALDRFRILSCANSLLGAL